METTQIELLDRQHIPDLEARERCGYEAHPHQVEEYIAWRMPRLGRKTNARAHCEGGPVGD
jgi:hypothetical protein